MEIRTVSTSKELDAFVELPFTLYKDSPYWVGDIKAETKKLLTKDPFWKHAKRALFIAYQDNKPIGRIAAVINFTHNEYWKENAGFFGFFECINDQPTANALFETARNWLKAEGAQFIRGPFNPSTNHPCGLLLDNFDKAPAIMMPYNFDYYSTLIEGAELSKAKDLLAFDRTHAQQFSPRMQKILERITKKTDIKLRNINMNNFEADVRTVREIYNAAWAKNWGFLPMSEEEIVAMAKELKMIVVPEFTAIAELNGVPVGFYITIPDMNFVLKILTGSLFNPVKLVRALIAWKKIKECRMIMLGVHPDHRGRGTELMLIDHIVHNPFAKGWDKAELSWILEDNTDIIKVMEEAGCYQTKRYRIYEEIFNPSLFQKIKKLVQ